MKSNAPDGFFTKPSSLLGQRKVGGVAAGDAALAVASGLLLTASFPKLDWEFLAWIAFVPLFWALKDKTPIASFKLGFITGLTHYLTLLYWISGVMTTYGHLPVVLGWVILFLMVAYLSLYPSLFAAMVSQLRTRSPSYVWSAPFLWVGLEYIRAFLLSGFPWENLGYSQYNRLHLIQVSDMFGVYGVSAVIIGVNTALFEFLEAIGQKRGISWKPTIVVAFVLVAFFSYGAWRITWVDTAAKAAPKQAVALVQGNIDQSKKWVASFQGETVRRYGKLSLAAMEARPDLVVWPETALPFFFLHDKALTSQVLELVRACKTHFILGSPSFRSQGQKRLYYNSAYLLGPSGEVLGKYDKVHLVPYGEYVPLRRFFPFLGKLVEAVGDFESGKQGQVLSFNTEKLGVLICFEAIFPELARAAVRNGAQLLVNITNDAWFGTSSAPYQHLSMAVFRSVENHRAMVRAANTGISAFIDPAGRLLDKTPLFQEAVQTHSLPLMREQTLYARHGDLFAIGCILLCIAIYLWAFRNRLPFKFDGLAKNQ